MGCGVSCVMRLVVWFGGLLSYYWGWVCGDLWVCCLCLEV